MTVLKVVRLLLVLAVGPLTALMLVTSVLADDIYVVKPGDTLGEIAEKHGVSVQALMAANNITDPNKLSEGQKLVIPRPAAPTAAAKPPATSAPAATAPPTTPSPTATSAPTVTASPTPKRVPADLVSKRSVLATRRIVTYYGHPNSRLMGILGELDPPALITQLKQKAKEYEVADPSRRTTGAIELIAIVAQGYPGTDGKYRARTGADIIDKYSRLAKENDMLLILDVQVGLSTVRTELEPLIPYLKQPHVHLALDPEFDMWPGQKPGQNLGHMTAYEINYAQSILRWIADDTDSPNKILLVHQFTSSMLPDKPEIEVDPRVDLAIVMDGFGDRSVKQKHYDMYIREEPVLFAGIKHFFKHDPTLMSPADTVRLNPPPDVVIYQ